jgi:DNA-binding NtrC family response regulator
MSDTGALVYVVDDDPFARDGVADLIRSAGLMARTFESGEFLAASRREMASCVVLDMKLPGMNGLDLQRELAKSGLRIPIIFLTGYADIPMTVRAVKAGAANFLTKPFEDEELLNAIRQCVTSDRKEEIRSETSLGPIVGNSQALKHVLELVQTVAPSDSTVLLLGETGTGKELIAHAIRNISPRCGRPFIKLNCAAIPFDLLESELFGHEKGAFTGAVAQKVGRFELADKGTLFLDEVGDIPLALQPKLLRVLQEQEFERLGSGHSRKVDIRLVAATHRDLTEMIKRNEFRADLYYRLNVFPIRLPPLRERPEDVAPLMMHYVDLYARRMGKQIEHIAPETVAAFTSYDWPGNIRELQNLIERAVLLSSDGVLPNPLPQSQPEPRQFPQQATMEEATRGHILKALEDSNWVLAGPGGAAARLGMKRSTLQFRIKKLGLSRPYPPAMAEPLDTPAPRDSTV